MGGRFRWFRRGRGQGEVLLALAAFAVLCIAALGFPPVLMEPDDYAYNASIVAMTQGHLLTLSTTQVHALAAHLPRSGDVGGPGIAQWVQLPSRRWISEKSPGYPFLAAPFQLLGVIRLAPLFYGALGCVGLFFGARRWLGRRGGAVAVGLFCFSGAALFFAWRDYMPTFTEASLIAAGTGALLWAVLATDATARRRIWAGLAGFVALEAAVFVRYSDIVVLGCAVMAVAVAWRLRSVRLPTAALLWWLGSVAVFGVGVALFDDVVYGGPLESGYRPGEITFGLSAVLPNFRYMPAHLIEAMPVLVPGLAALGWIIGRRVNLRVGGESAAIARRDFAVGIALAGSWFGAWGLYAAYTWTAQPGGSTLQVARFYVPAIGAMALLAAWLVARMPRRAPVAAVAAAALVATTLGLGAWSFNNMRETTPPVSRIVHSGHGAHRAHRAHGAKGEPSGAPGGTRSRAGARKARRAPLDYGLAATGPAVVPIRTRRLCITVSTASPVPTSTVTTASTSPVTPASESSGSGVVKPARVASISATSRAIPAIDAGSTADGAAGRRRAATASRASSNPTSTSPRIAAPPLGTRARSNSVPYRTTRPPRRTSLKRCRNGSGTAATMSGA
jgi:hypothetical protein